MACLAQLAEVIKASKTLATLDISENSVGPEGAAAIAPAVAVSGALTEVLAYVRISPICPTLPD